VTYIVTNLDNFLYFMLHIWHTLYMNIGY